MSRVLSVTNSQGPKSFPTCVSPLCSFEGSVMWQTERRLYLDMGDEQHDLGQRLDLWRLGFLINENSGYEDACFTVWRLGFN